MQNLSSPSSGARFLDKQGVISALRRLARDAKERAPVEGVFLFGSIATDNYTPRSDADILVVLKRDERTPRDRIPDYLSFFLDAPVPVDVFPFTEEEIEESPFLRKARREGIDLISEAG